MSSFNAIFDTVMHLRPPHYFHIKDKLRKNKAVSFARGEKLSKLTNWLAAPPTVFENWKLVSYWSEGILVDFSLWSWFIQILEGFRVRTTMPQQQSVCLKLKKAANRNRNMLKHFVKFKVRHQTWWHWKLKCKTQWSCGKLRKEP